MPAYVVGKASTASVNFVGNYFKAGSDTGAASWYVATHGVVRLYAEGNHVNNTLLRPSSKDAANRWSWRHPAPEVTTSTPEDAYRAVLSQGGASLGLNCNGTLFTRPDDVDRRIISEVEVGAGRIIDTPLEVGGWPKLSGGTACLDDDRDGIPNEWERLRGLNPTDGRDASEPSSSGYTWLEEYLNFTDVRFEPNVIRSQRSRQHAPRTKPR